MSNGSSLSGLDAKQVTVPAADQYKLQAEAFGRLVRTARPSPQLLNDAIQNMKIIDALFRAAKSGRISETLVLFPSGEGKRATNISNPRRRAERRHHGPHPRPLASRFACLRYDPYTERTQISAVGGHTGAARYLICVRMNAKVRLFTELLTDFRRRSVSAFGILPNQRNRSKRKQDGVELLRISRSS